MSPKRIFIESKMTNPSNSTYKTQSELNRKGRPMIHYYGLRTRRFQFSTRRNRNELQINI